MLKRNKLQTGLESILFLGPIMLSESIKFGLKILEAITKM